ncbi:unnamed protein product [Pylaiella littoralis]
MPPTSSGRSKWRSVCRQTSRCGRGSCETLRRRRPRKRRPRKRRRGRRCGRQNPFMMQAGLPKFGSITPEASEEAFNVLLEDLETGFAKFEEDLVDFTSSDAWGKQRMRHDFAGVVERMERLRAPLEYAWGVMTHLTGVKSSDPLRDAHQELQKRLMTEAQSRVVDAPVKQMELGGVGLLGVRCREASS